MSRIKVLWHDPVWSKVIAYGILFIVGMIGAYCLQWLGPLAKLATTATSIPNWLIALLLLLTFACFGFLIAFFRLKVTLKETRQTTSNLSFPFEASGSDIKEPFYETSPSIYLQRQLIHWIPYNDKIQTRYWASGTSLLGVVERNLIQDFYKKGIRDIKIILPATEPCMSSFHQLHQYDKLVKTTLVNNQVEEAEKSYKKLLACLNTISNRSDRDFIRLYRGIMYANITIFDDDAFIAFYDTTGIGDNSITIHFNRKTNERGYQQVEQEFMNMWKADPDYGRIPKKKKGASIIFINSSNHVLLFLRDNKEEIAFPNYWDVLGGHVEDDESPAMCIKREMREEIEIVLDNPQLFNVYDMDDRIEYTFWKKAEFDITALNLNEGQQLKWFTEENIRRMTDKQIAFNFKGIILDFYQKKPWLCTK
jgi:8-oxo-dGTP diphosphatase